MAKIEITIYPSSNLIDGLLYDVERGEEETTFLGRTIPAPALAGLERYREVATEKLLAEFPEASVDFDGDDLHSTGDVRGFRVVAGENSEEASEAADLAQDRIREILDAAYEAACEA